jgi:serine/threonine protein kinase
MADVLLGRSDGIEGFERHVVLKRIRPEHAKDQRFIRMFLDEARVAATLHHQHVVQVYDIGEASGEYFIAMEYLHGEDVRTVLSAASKRRAHTPLGIAIAIVSAAAAGLHYAHERTGSDLRPLGIVHRDVSPSNILVGYDGAIKVVDFGIAKATMGDDTQSGSLKGKISYMSPEQCKGAQVDRRSDVYALGVVLYELATTVRLFKGDNSYLVMDQIVHGRAPLPHVRRPDLPRPLSDIIMRALAPDRDQRYATADELRVALDQCAASLGLTASSSTIATYMRQQFGERPEPWLGLGTQQMRALDDVPTVIGPALPTSSWTEQPDSGVVRRATAAIPLPSDPTAIIGVDRRIAAAEPAVAEPAAAERPSSMQLPTSTKLAWESQPAPPPRAMSRAKLAMVGAPMLLLAGVAAWHWMSSPPPAADVAVAVQPAPPPPPATPPPAPPVVRDPALAMPAITLEEPDPLRKPRPVQPRASDPTRIARLAAAAPPARPDGLGELHRLTAPVALPAPEIAPRAVAPLPAPAPLPPPPAPAPVPAPVAPAPAVAQNIAPSALDANRISGDKRIVPDDSTKASISRQGSARIAGTYKLCVGVDGNVTSVTQITGTGFPAYDQTIQSTILHAWRYRPFVVNGRPTPVCTAVRFVYSQK